jgi:hypothetical protein
MAAAATTVMATAAAMAAAATAMATAATTMATAATAMGRGLDQGTTCILLIEEMEGGDAGVSKFFLTQHDRMSLRQIQRLRRVGCARRGSRRRCADERQSQSCSTQDGHRHLRCSLPLRSRLCL